MTYRLFFKAEAEKEWRKLDLTIKRQFKKKLTECLKNPHIPSARLTGMKNCYKIKFQSTGYGLVYEVRDKELVVSVVAIGKRERNEVYNTAIKRI